MNPLYTYGGTFAGNDIPQKYGAVADGIADCSAAIAQLLAANVGGAVYFPEGIYGISEPIKTYPYYDKGVNITFHPNAKIVPLTTMEYLLDIGALTEDTVSARGKKIIRGGIFDAYNGLVTKAVIHIRRGVQNIDFSDATIFASGCDGILVGDSGGSSSTDSYLHDLYIRHAGVANSHSGILFYSNDNNIENCRVYYFGTNINCQTGGQFFTDIHTLANGTDTIEQVTLLAKGEIFLTNFYGDSEDVFIKAVSGSIPRLFMNNCNYYSYKDNDVVIFDIEEGAKIKANGLCVTCRANTEYTGVKLPYSSFKDVLNPANFDVNGLLLHNPQYLKDGDPLKGMRTNGKDTFFLPTSMTNGTWYRVGAIATNDTSSQVIELISSAGKTEIPLSVRCSSSGTLSADATSGKIITTDSGTYQIGYKLNNSGFDSASEYPLVDVYIKRLSGASRTLYCFGIKSNYMARISPSGEMNVALSSANMTPDIICTVDCDNGTVAVAS